MIERARRAYARFGTGDLVPALAAMGLSLLLAVLVLRLWRADFSYPFDTSRGDVSFHLMAVKGMLDHGWFLSNPDLGAPTGQELYDFAILSGSNLHFAAMWVLGRFTSNPAVVVNAYYLLGYALTALAAFLVLRRLKVTAAVAAAVATVFAVLPVHFLRGEAHLSLSALFVVPVAAYLVIAVLAGWRLFAPRDREDGPRLLRYASRTSLVTVALVLLVALADLYYAAFTAILLIAASLLRLLVTRRWAAAIPALVLVAVIGAGVAFNQAPNLIYRLDHGPNEVAGKRTPAESEILSLSLTSLVMPIDFHRLPPLRKAANEYTLGLKDSQFGLPVGRAPVDRMGLISSIGLLALLAVALAACAGASSGWLTEPRLRLASAAGLTTLLLATTGGVSALIAYLLTPQLRGWDRAASFIAFFSLIAVAILLDRLRGRFSYTPRNRVVAVVLLLGLVGIAVFDQTSNRYVQDYDRQAAEIQTTKQFVISLEARLPAGAAIFELPYERFPEGTTKGRPSYEPLLPYLQSTDLRWSYGSMVGRPADRAAALKDTPPAKLVPEVVLQGFQGVLVDRLAYTDRGAAIVGGLAATIGKPPLDSADDRYAFFDLRPYARRRGA